MFQKTQESKRLHIKTASGFDSPKDQAPSPVAVAALLSGRCLEAFLPKNDAVAILESLELETRTSALLEGDAANVGPLHPTPPHQGGMNKFNIYSVFWGLLQFENNYFSH